MKRKVPKSNLVADTPVMVTTAHKGVFFGYVPRDQPRDVKTISVAKARNCLYWTSEMRGVMGLAAVGPKAGCKVGPAVPSITLSDVTAVIEVTPDAAARWEGAVWG